MPLIDLLAAPPAGAQTQSAAPKIACRHYEPGPDGRRCVCEQLLNQPPLDEALVR